MSEFLTTPDFPYCKGCGHHHVARYTVEALEALGLSPLDVVLVTDIGCHGIVLCSAGRWHHHEPTP
jgi:pyruvate/2-oxoacid:ferredoxin oxidoreductase beta subunit